MITGQSLSEQQRKQLESLLRNEYEDKKRTSYSPTYKSRYQNFLLNGIMKTDNVALFQCFYPMLAWGNKCNLSDTMSMAAQEDAVGIMEHIFLKMKDQPKPWERMFDLCKDGNHPKLKSFLMNKMFGASNPNRWFSAGNLVTVKGADNQLHQGYIVADPMETTNGINIRYCEQSEATQGSVL
jgi:hypothetical protein